MNNTSGILLINKPTGLTSRDVVNKASHILGTKKIGHTGTLDPLATGVLVLTIGKCTKLSSMLTSHYKEYLAEFTLGFETDTLDITGAITKKSTHSVDKNQIINTINSFQCTYEQIVPAYSAVKVNGKKLYEYSRSGDYVELPKRLVDIRSIEILSIEEDKIKIKTTVSKGTYIRSLIRDIGEHLGTFATMTSLVRTKQGHFNLEDCYELDELESGKFKIIPPEDFLTDIKSIETGDDSLKKVTNGAKMNIECDDKYIKFTKNDKILAIYQKEDNTYKMYVLLT